ncbi:glycosyl hydrolase family 38 [Romboutsia weinsteinii]|uniref:Glycosyl hydrolase family 38 n=1 Tax=Romboutsia weinsteinii TaxID=2020949 RepID=A0A371IYF7_9FIRM|nr:glycosyl hydrolase family 38 [Romboutsia weinsteinii]RDY25517.1 glycosyl hydrolase family 38 [Romboutsia weinsteinii]
MDDKKLNKKWEVLLIHHTHTDIGYTQTQENIEHYHVNFIKQAIEIAEKLRVENRESEFVWVCESFWNIEVFLKAVDESWKNRLNQCILNKSIEITGNYLNLNELIDYDVLKNHTKRAIDYTNSIGTDINSAITADINGYAWGYSDALCENGIKNLFSCVHTHHGMYPLFKKQTPFYWQTPKGEKLLVWNGEHYHFGNEFGIVKTATGSYINKDELGANFTSDNRHEIGTKRLYRYLKNLENEGYEYNFIPITVHGLPTDNGSPNIEVLEFVDWWNSSFGQEVTIKMTSLENFFDKVRNIDISIPIYSGDWPDWWAFGVGSTPQINKIYKEAQRILNTTKMIDKNMILSDKELINECENKLMLYAEHTWGHSSSVTHPWNSFVNLLDYKNSSYAINAHEAATRNFLKVLDKKEISSLKPNREPKFKIINPYDREITESVKLSLDYWETSTLKEVIVDQDNNEYVTQSESHPRGTYINFVITLKANEERVLYVKRYERDINYVKNSNESACCQGINDIYIYDEENDIKKYENTYENKNIKITWDYEKGIVSWFDKVNQVELIDQSSRSGAFMPIYEITKAKGQNTDEQYKVRQRLGRNMRGINAKLFYPIIEDISIAETGDVFTKIVMNLNLEGTSLIRLEFKIYNEINKADVVVIINKDSVWDPESLYIALPFTFNDDKMDLFIEKTGCVIQAKKDQLPGTNVDFYLSQGSIGLKHKNYGVSIAMMDSSLVYTSKLQYENSKKLYHEKYTNQHDYELYSWVMNNIWETNFKASLGGFIEFNYSISWENGINDKFDLINKSNQMDLGFVSYRVD